MICVGGWLDISSSVWKGIMKRVRHEGRGERCG